MRINWLGALAKYYDNIPYGERNAILVGHDAWLGPPAVYVRGTSTAVHRHDDHVPKPVAVPDQRGREPAAGSPHQFSGRLVLQNSEHS